MTSHATPEMIERAQRILDQKPNGIGWDFSAQGAFMDRIADQEGVSRAAVARIWRKQSYSYLRRSGQTA